MPTISSFFGIFIRMYLRDHPPPHFHAIYQGHEANVAIETGDVVEGRLPPVAGRLVQEWTLAHRQELLDNWERARRGEPLERIPRLDDE